MCKDNGMKSMKEILLSRQACRSYNGERVEHEKLIEIIEAGRLSPSARNSQPWSFVLAESKEKVGAVCECVRLYGRNIFADNCSAFIVIYERDCEQAFGGVEHKYFAEMDIGMCTVNMCNMAQSLGVSSCIIGSFDREKLSDAAGIADAESIKLVLALGYASEGYPIREKSRDSIDEILTII